MSDPFEAVGATADQAFAEFGALLKGSGADVGRSWADIELAKAEHDAAATLAADGIDAIRDNPYLTEQERAVKLQQARDIFDSTDKALSAKVQAGLATLRASLDAAARSDLTPADAADRALIRQELRLKLAATAAPQGTRGKSTYQALMEIVQSNPSRYGPEVAAFGPDLLAAAGEGAFAKDLRANIIRITPGTTPKSQAARAALDAITKTRIEGHATGAILAHRSRVQKALEPRKPQGYQPDTMIPRR